jgi:hypothetical protein
MNPAEIHTKQAHLWGLEALGESHPEHAKMKEMVERKFDPTIKANFTAEEKRQMHRLVLLGADWINSKPPSPVFRDLFQED